MPARPLVALLAAPLLLALGSACPKDQGDPKDPGRVCSEIGCVNGLEIELEKKGRWEAGEYTFLFDLDGVGVTCEGALPLPACETRAITCSGDAVVISESGCAMPAAEQGFSDLRIDGEPAQVAVTIKRGEHALFTGVLAPTYTTRQPNGPGCEPTCRGSRAKLELR